MTKIIFLDVDGVLNHQLYYTEKRQCDRSKEVGYPACEFDPAKIELLNMLCKDTKAKVVISSSWRQGRTVEELVDIFESVGFEGEIIDKTPKLHFRELEGEGYMSVPRGNEIHAWLQDNKSLLHTGIGKYTSYVIFDDDSDMLYWQRNNFIWVDPYCGLTPNLIYKAKQILSK